MPRPSEPSKAPSGERGRGGGGRPAGSGAGPGARPPVRSGRDARAPRSRRLPRLIVAAFLGGLVVGAGVASFRHRSHRLAAAVAPAAPAVALPPAEQSLRETVTHLPRDPDAHRALARYLLEQQRPFAALWQFLAAQELE